MYTLLLMIFSMIVSLIFTAFVIKVSHKLVVVDQPNFRKVHRKTSTVLGGTMILLFFLLAIWLGHPIETEVKPLVIGAVLTYLVGLIDDIYDLTRNLKLLGQVI